MLPNHRRLSPPDGRIQQLLGPSPTHLRLPPISSLSNASDVQGSSKWNSITQNTPSNTPMQSDNAHDPGKGSLQN